MKTPKKIAAPPRPRLIGYCRVSTESQADRGVSLDAQEDRLRAYAKATGVELLAVVRETASGRLAPARRPILSAALAQIRSGEADGLLCLRLDRVSRRMRDAVNLLDESAKKNWRFVSVEQHLDTGSAMGRFTATLLASLAALEAEQISERTTAGLAQVAREGRGRSRILPYGWRSASGSSVQERGDRRKLVEHPEEQAILRKIASWRKQGWGPARIARALNKAGLTTRAGKPWGWHRTHSVLATIDIRASALGAV